MKSSSYQGSAHFGGGNAGGSNAAAFGMGQAGDLMAMLKELNSKFDNLNERVTGKIDRIEQGYEQLSAKIDTFGRGNGPMMSSFGATQQQ